MRAIVISVGIFLLGTASAGAAAFTMAASTPPAGQSYVYTARTKGGKGDAVIFNVPTLPPGYYTATWDANFYPKGSTSSPVEWSCALSENGGVIGQAMTTDTGFFFVGVSGSISVRVRTGDTLSVQCGNNLDNAWLWAGVPLQVQFTRDAARTSGPLPFASEQTPREMTAPRRH